MSSNVQRPGFEYSRLLTLFAAPWPFCLALRLSVDWRSSLTFVRFFKTCRWQSQADRVLKFRMTIGLPLFSNTWSLSLGKDSSTRVGGRVVSHCNDSYCISSLLFHRPHYLLNVKKTGKMRTSQGTFKFHVLMSSTSLSCYFAILFFMQKQRNFSLFYVLSSSVLLQMMHSIKRRILPYYMMSGCNLKQPVSILGGLKHVLPVGTEVCPISKWPGLQQIVEMI